MTDYEKNPISLHHHQMLIILVKEHIPEIIKHILPDNNEK
jgi:hypothetical protein